MTAPNRIRRFPALFIKGGRGASKRELVRMLAYGGALAAGVLTLQLIDYQRLVRSQPGDVWLAVVASIFLVVGVFVGARLFAPPRPGRAPGNPEAQAALGISPREMAVLHEIAAGRSNKEIALSLAVSPNTVKTHVARLLEKLGAKRRTDALAKAREIGILP